MKYKILFLLFLLLPFTSCAQHTTEHNSETAQQLDIFNALYGDLDKYYVDTLSAKSNIDNAILYMLSKIDPYTEYYPASKTSELERMTSGQYAGIGSMIQYRPKLKHCIIAEPYEGQPAAQAGLKIGDMILAVDGKPIGDAKEGTWRHYSDSVSALLRGVPGTKFDLTVKRYGVDSTLTFNITRRRITLPSVTFYKMLRPHVGYIRLASFTQQTTPEMIQALTQLKEEGMQKLILDLRGNPGGLLDQAVSVVGMFVPRGKTVVSTKGKIPSLNMEFKTQSEPIDLTSKMVVLTDFGSASAAEITAGALQDYDRATIIGRKTYGKGLVQQTHQLPHGGILKLTTSKYYIPSGRCIQAYKYKNGVSQHLPDSLAKVFHTESGREVRDSGGITPDEQTVLDTLPNLITELALSDAINHYCSDYLLRHPQVAPPSQFQLSDTEYNRFKEFIKAEKFTYDTRSKEVLKLLREIARREGYQDVTQNEFAALESKLVHNYDYDFAHWKKQIKELVGAELMKRCYYQRGEAEYTLRYDKDLQHAFKVLAQ